MVQIGRQKWQPIPYKEYIKGDVWAERKRMYFLSHPHKCEVCQHVDVEVHHAAYGSLGFEKDKNLAALCRVHHGEIHKRMPLRNNMYYHTRAIIDQMKEEWEAMRSGSVTTQPVVTNEKSVADLIERLAAPIWKLIDFVLRR